MVDLVISTGSFDINEAGVLLSVVGNLKVSQIVNPNKTMRMELDKKYIDLIS